MSSFEIDEEFDEDTYSTIFAALKHPIRRRILRMLSEKPLSFTEILNSLLMNSPQLSFHIRSLKELIKQTDDGKYSLSTFGKAACYLMGIVEEPKRTVATMIQFKWALIAILLAIFMPFIKYEPGPFGPISSWTFSIGFPVAILILVWQYFGTKRILLIRHSYRTIEHKAD